MRHKPYSGLCILSRVLCRAIFVMVNRLNKNKCVVNHPHQDY
nr:MAG TPA: hypothetical protein [Bacteriophage sp.]